MIISIFDLSLISISKPMIIFANAKINIGLNIISRTHSRYHNLQTVFYPIPLYDIIELSVISTKQNSIEFYSSGIIIDSKKEENLCVKAYRLLQESFNLPAIKVHLHKQIPLGAGLGGGSSDAAFLLKAINDIANLNMNNKQLKEIATKLGADCPFFIDNNPAYAEGIGEKLSPIKDILDGSNLLLILPKIHISTAEAYSNITPIKPKFNLQNSFLGDNKMWKTEINNQFEPFAFNKHKELKQIKDNLYKNGAYYASMSGSGSAMYGLFEKKPIEINISENHKIIELKLDKKELLNAIH